MPGAFDAWCLMLRDWGTWEFADVLDFAIGYAENGIHVVPRISAAIETVRPLFEAEWQTICRGVPAGRRCARARRAVRASRPGRDLAPALPRGPGTTREARIDAARNAWYRGFVAEAVDRFLQRQGGARRTGRRHRGLLTADDLARWAATVEQPLSYDYHGHTVLKCGPWSQGPVFLQQLALLRGFDIGAMDPIGAEFVHTRGGGAKLAFADREAYYGDPEFRARAARCAAVG